MKRLLAMLCVGAMLVTGCGSGGSETSEPTEKPSQGNKYVEQDFYSVPDELLDEDEIQVTSKFPPTGKKTDDQKYNIQNHGDYRQMQRESRRFISMQ